MNTQSEITELILSIFGSEKGASIVGVVTMVLSVVWIVFKRYAKKVETSKIKSQNLEEPSLKIASTKRDNQTASKEWKSAQDKINKLINEQGEGTLKQPSEPKKG